MEALWELFWESWGAAGKLLELLGDLLNSLGTVSGALGGSGCDIFVILGALHDLGASWDALGVSWQCPGGVLRAYWHALRPILDAFRSYFGPNEFGAWKASSQRFAEMLESL